jgi:hypothetical protein
MWRDGGCWYRVWVGISVRGYDVKGGEVSLGDTEVFTLTQTR